LGNRDSKRGEAPFKNPPLPPGKGIKGIGKRINRKGYFKREVTGFQLSLE
jgi:hypothetical protein